LLLTHHCLYHQLTLPKTNRTVPYVGHTSTFLNPFRCGTEYFVLAPFSRDDRCRALKRNKRRPAYRRDNLRKILVPRRSQLQRYCIRDECGPIPPKGALPTPFSSTLMGGKSLRGKPPIEWDHRSRKVPHILYSNSVRSRLVFLACGNLSRLGPRPRVSFRFLLQSICGAREAGRLRFVLRHWFQELGFFLLACPWILDPRYGDRLWSTIWFARNTGDRRDNDGRCFS
jgi:hypothetical protein